MKNNHPNRKRRGTASAVSSAPRPSKPRAHLAPGRSEHDHNRDYAALLRMVASTFHHAGAPLFTTDADPDALFAMYLNAVSPEQQIHDCHTCRQFFRRYGALVAIDATTGVTRPAMWPSAGGPEFYASAVDMLHRHVAGARVTGVFYAKESYWGTPALPANSQWTHFNVMPTADRLYTGKLLTPGQAMAAARENFKTVKHALTELSADGLDQAIRIVEAEAVDRSERFLGPLKWLRALHERPRGRLYAQRGDNVLWAAIATAPEGYCHPRASVIGPLVEDIVAGLPFSTIKAKFNAMVAPLKYQRPQAAPAAGNIAAAEAIVAKLGIERSLARRYARLDEVLPRATWVPGDKRPAHVRADAERGGGVFAHLTPKGVAGAVNAVTIPGDKITWTKLRDRVLPDAERIELQVPNPGRFIAMTTAEHFDAPPIIKWDRDAERNPFGWYVYPNGSMPMKWGLRTGAWVPVLGVVPFPPMWGSTPQPHLGNGDIVLLDGAHDTTPHGGLAIFPELLQQELHWIRSTVEAHSRSREFAVMLGSACGYDIRPADAKCRLRVFAGGAWTTYDVDRWD